MSETPPPPSNLVSAWRDKPSRIETQIQRMEQAARNAAELALAFDATTSRLGDLMAGLQAQRLDHERQRRLLLWLPIAALMMSLAGNAAAIWFAWDSNRTILAAWTWKGAVEAWAERTDQKLQEIDQRLAKPAARPMPK